MPITRPGIKTRPIAADRSNERSAEFSCAVPDPRGGHQLIGGVITITNYQGRIILDISNCDAGLDIRTPIGNGIVPPRATTDAEEAVRVAAARTALNALSEVKATLDAAKVYPTLTLEGDGTITATATYTTVIDNAMEALKSPMWTIRRVTDWCLTIRPTD